MVARSGIKYPQLVQTLQFRFKTPTFSGKVPRNFTTENQNLYLAEASKLLRDQDIEEDKNLTYPPWIFYLKEKDVKKICKVVMVNFQLINTDV